MTKISFEYIFHPVGQGLFSSGVLRKSPVEPINHLPFLQWVYDCGSSSAKNLVTEAISHLKDCSQKNNRLDLVTLSHFDHDHISGICQLISTFEIDTLMLPYMSQEQRLWMAFEEDISPDDDLISFFVNPTEYLSGLEGSRIRNILYVPPSGDESSPPQPEVLPNDDGGGESQESTNESSLGENNVRLMNIDVDQAPENNDPASTNGQKTEVKFLKQGGAIRYRAFWEFVPYNDDPAEHIPDAFCVAVQSERDKLIKAASNEARKLALKNLKGLYQIQFGKGSEERNIISLFLFAGPIYSAWRHFGYTELLNWYRATHDKLFCRKISNNSSARKSILYTGDGYLDNNKRLTRLINFFGQERVDRVGVMQVMHHGSENNWHKGLAESFKPLFSIFSSDPNRKKWGHPHAAVLRDFWCYGPVQVNKSKKARIDNFGDVLSSFLVK